MTYSPEWQSEAAKSHGEMLEARVSLRPVTHGTATNLWDWTVDNVSYPASAGDTGPSTGSTIQTPISSTGAPTRKLEFYEYGQIQYDVPSAVFANATTTTFSMYLHGSTDENYDGGAYPYDWLKFGIRNITRSDSCGVYIGRTAESSRVDFEIDSTWGSEIISWSMHAKESDNGGADFWRRFEFTIDWSGTWVPEDEYNFYIHGPGTPAAYTSDLIWSSPMIEIDKAGQYASEFFETESEITTPGELFELGDFKDTIGMNPIARKRERKFGVVQGQETQITVGNISLDKLEQSKPGSLICVEMGFPSIDEWELAVQGTVSNVKTTTDLKLFINIADPIRGIMDSKLDKDIFFGQNAWVSDVKTVSKDDDSNYYDNDQGSISIHSSLSGSVKDETYQIRFISGSEFQIFNSQDLPLSNITGDFIETGTTFLRTSSAGFGPREMHNRTYNMFTIDDDGWDTTYVSGDTFEFHTSAPRTIEQLKPIGMVKHIIEDVLNVRVYDVLSGQYYDSPFHDDTVWNAKVAASEGQVGGLWTSGSRVIEMLQDALILEHATIFPTETGQLGIWVVDGAQPGATYLNGLPGADVVNILSASIALDNDEFANVINIEYKDLSDGSEKTQTVESLSKDRTRNEMKLTTKWRVQDAAARTCISRGLVRFNYDRKTYEITTPLSLATVDLTDPITITEPFLGLGGDKAEVTERHLSLASQSIKLIGWNDKLATLNKARIDITRIDQTEETVW